MLFEPLDSESNEIVHGLVKQHAEETGSAFAAGLLADWENASKRFPAHIVRSTSSRHAEGGEERRREEGNIDFNVRPASRERRMLPAAPVTMEGAALT
ncbi:MAG: hypothetical protein ACLT3W_02910 [Bifidobacterium pseudocatenulatum]